MISSLTHCYLKVSCRIFECWVFSDYFLVFICYVLCMRKYFLCDFDPSIYLSSAYSLVGVLCAPEKNMPNCYRCYIVLLMSTNTSRFIVLIESYIIFIDPICAFSLIAKGWMLKSPIVIVNFLCVLLVCKFLLSVL